MFNKIVPLYSVVLDFDTESAMAIYPKWMQELPDPIRITEMGKSPYSLMRHIARMAGYNQWRCKNPNDLWITLPLAFKEQLHALESELLASPEAWLKHRADLNVLLLTMAGAAIIEARNGYSSKSILSGFKLCFDPLLIMGKKTIDKDLIRDIDGLKRNLLQSMLDMSPLFFRNQEAKSFLREWVASIEPSENGMISRMVEELNSLIHQFS